MLNAESLTFVLVHGAFQGSWCWSRLTPLLEQEGHHVATVTLTGLGEKAHLLNEQIDLDTHVSDVVDFLTSNELSDVILVGHSYGGMVITGAAERSAERIRRLVYLDALVPTNGQSVFDLNSDTFRDKLEIEAKEHGDGFMIPAWPAKRFCITDPVDVEWVESRLTPHPIATFRQPVEAKERAAGVPGTFIYCTQFGFKDTAGRCKANGWPVLTIETGHEAMLTKPQELAELLLSPECH